MSPAHRLESSAPPPTAARPARIARTPARRAAPRRAPPCLRRDSREVPSPGGVGAAASPALGGERFPGASPNHLTPPTWLGRPVRSGRNPAARGKSGVARRRNQPWRLRGDRSRTRLALASHPQVIYNIKSFPRHWRCPFSAFPSTCSCVLLSGDTGRYSKQLHVLYLRAIALYVKRSSCIPSIFSMKFLLCTPTRRLRDAMIEEEAGEIRSMRRIPFTVAGFEDGGKES
ncbi:uncharacterized protein LOC115506039 [Lynx canadensis]|uniref:uncharacterized protein LOC115506039 n=1 Tax=Lynx canadensis TaxID=61383 RepID=UPI0011AFDBAE|nr:uncharacterized protein LOC115506039 [Lynx canadensis]